MKVSALLKENLTMMESDSPQFKHLHKMKERRKRGRDVVRKATGVYSGWFHTGDLHEVVLLRLCTKALTVLLSGRPLHAHPARSCYCNFMVIPDIGCNNVLKSRNRRGATQIQSPLFLLNDFLLSSISVSLLNYRRTVTVFLLHYILDFIYLFFYI